MALHSPSKTSFAVRSAAPGRQTTVGRSHRPSSRRVVRPFGAPSPRNPLPGTVCSSGVGRRLSPSVGSGRPTRAHTPVVPPYLVAGVQSRFGPPPPFPTTLTACSSSGPVECFVHSRPWGSSPGSPLHLPGRAARRPSFPVLVRASRTEVLATRTRGASARSGGSRSTPRPHRRRSVHSVARPPLRPVPRSHRSDSAFSNGPAPAPRLDSVPSPCPDHRSGHSPGLPVPPGDSRRCRRSGHRGGEPSRPSGPAPCRGCLSCSSRPRSWDVPGHNRSRRERVRACGHHVDGRRLEPACAPGRPASRRIYRLRRASLAPVSRCRSRRAGRVSPGLLATRTQSICQ
jgi:hypothetical protein